MGMPSHSWIVRWQTSSTRKTARQLMVQLAVHRYSCWTEQKSQWGICQLMQMMQHLQPTASATQLPVNQRYPQLQPQHQAASPTVQLQQICNMQVHQTAAQQQAPGQGAAHHSNPHPYHSRLHGHPVACGQEPVCWSQVGLALQRGQGQLSDQGQQAWPGQAPQGASHLRSAQMSC